MLIAEASDLLPTFRQALREAYPMALISDMANQSDFAIEFSTHSRVYIEYDGPDLESIGWEVDEISIITTQFRQCPNVYSLAYHGIDAIKQVVIILANSDQVMIDNDCGDLMIGSMFVARILKEPDWNWLQDFYDREV
ncbi:hypothetical protein [Hymenobacter sp.]|uniref:hypothetical protein n=1 Tax=Hymenobacter sp. TaxID=1898978 RepID=UPI00286B2361|nr:hypothetical protein [Hymenobacter sp.]